MRRGAEALRTPADLTRIGLGVGHELGQRLYRHVLVNDHDLGGVDELADRHKRLDLELEEALKPLDVDQLLLVIDACNSGQALQAADARRGPMNARGLAQLAYEKGMYVLTASQSDEVAFESAGLKHSYLAYALVASIVSTTLFLSGGRFEAAPAPRRMIALAIAVGVAMLTRNAAIGMFTGTVVALLLSWFAAV